MATPKIDQMEYVAVETIKVDIEKEKERLKGLWENLKKILEDGIRDSFKYDCLRGYTKMLDMYVKRLKKKHKELNKKLPKDKRKPFELSKSDKKFIEKIKTLIIGIRTYLKFYKKKFQPAFRSPKHFFNFFFLKYDILKARDYSDLKNFLEKIYGFNKTLPSNWRFEVIEGDLSPAIKFVLKNYFTTLDREIEDFKKKVIEPARKIQEELEKNKNR